MSQTFSLIAIIGFSLAAVLVVIAVVMFFRLDIRRVRDNLTGKTATRSIAEIRSRAKTRKRVNTDAVKKLGWEQSGQIDLPSQPLKDVFPSEDDVVTIGLSSASFKESATTILSADDDESATTILSPGDEVATTILDGETETIVFSHKSPTKTKKGIIGIVLAAAMLTTLGFGALKAEGIPSDSPVVITFKDSISFDLEAPHGVDIQEWVNNLDLYEQDLDYVKGLFADKAPLKIVPAINPSGDYPSGNPAPVLAAQFDTPQNPEVDLPSTDDIKITVADPKICYPKDILFKLGNQEVTPYIAGEGIDMKLWVSSTNFSMQKKPASPALQFVKEDDFKVKGNGSLNQSSNSISFSDADTYPATAYVKLKEAQTLNEEQPEDKQIKLLAGEIIKLPQICVDTKEPTFGEMIISPSEPIPETFIVSKNDIKIKVQVFDLPEVEGNPTSGINGDSVVVKIGNETHPAEYVAYDEVTHMITITFPAGDNGMLMFEDISIEVSDNVGTPTTIDSVKDYDLKNIDPTTAGVLFDTTPPVLTVSYDNNDVHNARYYKTDRIATIAVTEKFFELTRDYRSGDNPVIATIKREGEAQDILVRESDFTQSENSDTWTTTVPLTIDGDYEIKASYTDLAGNKATDFSDIFTIDKVKPIFGAATLSTTEPVHWNWICSPDAITLNISLSDELSGIDPNALFLKVAEVDHAVSYDMQTGILSATFEANDRRIYLKDIKVIIHDMAGNEQPIANLRNYDQLAVDPKIEGFYSDSAAPVLTVAYDNNDVHNGQYYSAARTLVVTIEEASFDLVVNNDPYLTILTQTRDGAERAIKAKEFKNPSKDGITWVAYLADDADGAYRTQADYIDLSGKKAQSYRDSFIVDATAPLIMLTFDNNDYEGGMYFKAPRTATITIYEKSFNESLASVVTQAQGGGVPGITGWKEATPGVWQTTVYFGEEVHYWMTIDCIDLADNVAKTVEEKEFVIDLTAPTVRVERVQNGTAYAEQIAPLVYFEDINFEPFLAQVEIKGATQGDTVYFMSEETTTDTSRTLDYEDFRYELKNDDVYTLEAKIKDKAGNESQQTVVFSVNRFGSNYRFAEDCKGCIGSYLKSAQTITVIETNVSGLQSQEARLSKNDSTRPLAAAQDYQVNAVGDQSSWSQYEYVFPTKLFASDAFYRILLSSRDAAGNLSENLMAGKSADRNNAFAIEFAVDGTAPIGSLGNVSNGSTHFSPSHRVDVYAGDNMDMYEATLYINGQAAQTWSAAEFKEKGMLVYDIAASDSLNDLKVVVSDKAGNTATITKNEVLVTNDVFRYAVNTPSIFYPAVAILAILVTVLAALIARLVEKKKNEERDAEEARVIGENPMF